MYQQVVLNAPLYFSLSINNENAEPACRRVDSTGDNRVNLV